MISPLLPAMIAPNFGGHTIALVDLNNTLLVDGKPINVQGVANPAELEGFQKLDSSRQNQIVAQLGVQITAIIGGQIVETPVTLNAFDTEGSSVGDELTAIDGDVVSNNLSLNISGSAVIQAEEAPVEGQPEN